MDVDARAVHEVDDLAGDRDRQVAQIIAPSVGDEAAFDEVGPFKSEIDDAIAALRAMAAPILGARKMDGNVGQQRRLAFAGRRNPT